jgi:hypothetical protein
VKIASSATSTRYTGKHFFNGVISLSSCALKRVPAFHYLLSPILRSSHHLQSHLTALVAFTAFSKQLLNISPVMSKACLSYFDITGSLERRHDFVDFTQAHKFETFNSSAVRYTSVPWSGLCKTFPVALRTVFHARSGLRRHPWISFVHP